MVAEILKSSSTFASVDYNERKVAKGQAELLEMKNFGYLQELGLMNSRAMRQYLIDYSAKNDRIRNTQFHVAISCKGHEYSFEQLMEIAHKYMDAMGYGMDGQPVLIYGHHDTDNNHIHIITSRVDPQGNKISDSFERVKSQKVLDEIMGVDRDKQMNTAISKALSYLYEGAAQFFAVLESSGYECKVDRGDVSIIRSGVIQGTLKLSDIERHKSKDYLTDARKRQLKAILEKYRDMSSSKEELRDIMKDKFGVDLIFLGSKDEPYGYYIVDHNYKSVYKGSSALSLKSLLTFKSKEERLRNTDMTIDAMLEDNNMLTTRELNRMLRRQFATYISKGMIVCGKDKVKLKKHILKTLERNDKRHWLQSFNPATEAERRLLCKMGGLNKTSLLTLNPVTGPKQVGSSIDKINEAIKKGSLKTMFSSLRAQGVVLMVDKGSYYCIDLREKVIFKPSDYKIKIPSGASVSSGKSKSKRFSGGSSSGQASDANREWEVGNNGRYDEIDDERTLKR